MASDVPYQPRQLPPWGGPPFTPVAPSIQPLEKPADYPFDSATSQNPNLFPPVCIRSHWDPTQILKRTLPQAQVATPLDPRPWTRVCMQYTTSSDFEEAPRPSDSVVFPSGGTVYPPNRYKEAIDQESDLRRLDRPLGTCERDQYIPPRSGDMYSAQALLPERHPLNNRFIQELSVPQATLRAGVYDCVADAQAAAFSRSPMPFNNATKQARYAVQRKDLIRQPSQPLHEMGNRTA